jgi:PAS domain S-box-containing protein
MLRLKAQRCVHCNKMLFRGALGMGIAEVKCSRCGQISTLHSFNLMLRGRTDVYILVYNPDGRIIISSESAEELLGYSQEELKDMSIQDISPKNQLYAIGKRSNPKELEEWEKYHANLPPDITHIAKSGESVQVFARFFPMAAYKDFYTVGIYRKVS